MLLKIWVSLIAAAVISPSEQACRAAKLPIDEVLDSLEAAELASQSSGRGHDWQREPLADLVTHITSTHHKYAREEIARLAPLFDKVCSVHGKNHPELQII